MIEEISEDMQEFKFVWERSCYIFKAVDKFLVVARHMCSKVNGNDRVKVCTEHCHNGNGKSKWDVGF